MVPSRDVVEAAGLQPEGEVALPVQNRQGIAVVRRDRMLELPQFGGLVDGSELVEAANLIDLGGKGGKVRAPLSAKGRLGLRSASAP
jgi:hypothetical protein